MATNTVVLGAGVMGLTTALLLARRGGYNITIIAKHMPGDYDIEYASPWAGANWLPLIVDPCPVDEFFASSPKANVSGLTKASSVGKQGSAHANHERDTFPELARLAKELPEAGIHFQDAIEYRRTKDTNTAVGEWFKELTREDAWFKEVTPSFRVLPQSELPEGVDGGTRFTSICINTAIYLPWLASQCLRLGVTIRRGIVSHISDAAKLHHSGRPADVVVNCTGLASLHLGGVEDGAMYPGRGQIVVVRSEPGIMMGTSGTDDGPDEAMYIMNRAAGGGCVLGGCLQKNNWESQPDPSLAIRIMKRCVELCPQLVPGGKGIEGLSVIRHGVGLRPMREGGMRIESETIPGRDGGSVKVVHNYGHGGYGYQTSYSAAAVAAKLVSEAAKPSARL